MANTKLVESWTFKRTLPDPFGDYTDNPTFKDVASKHCTQPQKKSTLHASTLQAILTYMELEEPTGSKAPEELGGDRKPDQFLYDCRISQPDRGTPRRCLQPVKREVFLRPLSDSAGYGDNAGQICTQGIGKQWGCHAFCADANPAF